MLGITRYRWLEILRILTDNGLNFSAIAMLDICRRAPRDQFTVGQILLTTGARPEQSAKSPLTLAPNEAVIVEM
jgi:hypothetical protein